MKLLIKTHFCPISYISNVFLLIDSKLCAKTIVKTRNLKGFILSQQIGSNLRHFKEEQIVDRRRHRQSRMLRRSRNFRRKDRNSPTARTRARPRFELLEKLELEFSPTDENTDESRRRRNVAERGRRILQSESSVG